MVIEALRAESIAIIGRERTVIATLARDRLGINHEVLCGSGLPCFETSPFSSFDEVSDPAIKQQMNANLPIRSIGTKLALSKSLLGVPANLTCKERSRGARNSANRESHGLSLLQVTNLIAATAHAKAIGLPFTRMVTIHWEAAGIALAGIVKATGRFVDLLTKFLARHGSRTAWLWVLENGPRKGAHCHMLAHVPPHLVPRLPASQKRWLRGITGRPYEKRVMRSDPIGGRLGLETGNPELHASNLEAAFAYLLKGASTEAADHFDLARRTPGGRILGRRCSTSQNIGQGARASNAAKLQDGSAEPCG